MTTDDTTHDHPPRDYPTAGHPADESPLGRRALLAHLALSAVGLAALPRYSRAVAPRLASRLTERLTDRVLERVTRRGARGESAAPLWDDRFELLVDFEIAAPAPGERYHRPYVAVWVEDPTGTLVRTLSLWVNTSGRGPRYIHELRRWFTADRAAEAAGGPDLVATVSSATRLPGRYAVTWDGRDDRGRPVAQGTYHVFIEAAREHGSYQLLDQERVLATTPSVAALPGNEEIGSARVEFRRRA